MVGKYLIKNKKTKSGNKTISKTNGTPDKAIADIAATPIKTDINKKTLTANGLKKEITKKTPESKNNIAKIIGLTALGAGIATAIFYGLEHPTDVIKDEWGNEYLDLDDDGKVSDGDKLFDPKNLNQIAGTDGLIHYDINHNGTFDEGVDVAIGKDEDCLLEKADGRHGDLIASNRELKDDDDNYWYDVNHDNQIGVEDIMVSGHGLTDAAQAAYGQGCPTDLDAFGQGDGIADRLEIVGSDNNVYFDFDGDGQLDDKELDEGAIREAVIGDQGNLLYDPDAMDSASQGSESPDSWTAEEWTNPPRATQDGETVDPLELYQYRNTRT